MIFKMESKIYDKPKTGINLIGYFQGSFGLGEAGRLLAESLEKGSIPFTLVSADFLAQHHHQEKFSGNLSNKFVYPINLFCIDPRHIFPFVARHGWECFQKNYNISMCFWETNILPNSHRQPWSFLDEIWAPTRYVQEHLSITTPVPVYRIAHPMQLSYTPQKSDKQSFGLENKFTFLFCFCFYSVLGRKNPFAIIEAFRRAFPKRQDVQLVIKSQNGDRYPEKLKTILNSIHNDSRIIWMDQSLTSQRRYDLMQACDCYISLHRSEGLGLTMAEAMLMGKPVIATGYSGNLDFMTQENSFLCPYRLVKIGSGHPPYAAEGIWADVDVDQAAFWMNYVVANPEQTKTIAEKGRNFLLDYFSCNVVGSQIANRIQNISFNPKPKFKPWLFKRAKIAQAAIDHIPFLHLGIKSAKKTIKQLMRKFQ